MALFLLSVAEKILHPLNDVKQFIPYSELDKRVWMKFKTGDGDELGQIEIRLFNQEQPVQAQKFSEFCTARPLKPCEFGLEEEPSYFIGTRISTISSQEGIIWGGATMPDDHLAKVTTIAYSRDNTEMKAAIADKFNANKSGTVFMCWSATDSTKVGTQFFILIHPEGSEGRLKLPEVPGEYKQGVVVGRVERDAGGLDLLSAMLRKYGSSNGKPSTPILISDCGNF